MTREEAIRWLTNEKWTNANNKYKKEWNEAFDMAIEALSADAVQEAVPTVVRVTMSDGSQYYLEHERDAIQAEAAQGEWKIDEYGIYHCPFCHAINNTVYKSFCPNCGARMKGGVE
jgi:predicted transglutaminase-like protease